jgi:hypothetical protein
MAHLSKSEVALPVVTDTVVALALQAVIVLHSVVDFVWTVVLESDTDVIKVTFWVHTGIAFELHELETEVAVVATELDAFSSVVVTLDGASPLLLLSGSRSGLVSSGLSESPSSGPLLVLLQQRHSPHSLPQSLDLEVQEVGEALEWPEGIQLGGWALTKTILGES